jgi:hypothetical protein
VITANRPNIGIQQQRYVNVTLQRHCLRMPNVKLAPQLRPIGTVLIASHAQRDKHLVKQHEFVWLQNDKFMQVINTIIKAIYIDNICICKINMYKFLDYQQFKDDWADNKELFIYFFLIIL